MALITVLMWSTLAPAVKLTMTEIPTLEMLSITAGLAFLFLLLYNGIRGKLSLLRKMSFRTILKMAGLGFLGLFLYSALYYYGIDQLTSSEACILNYLWPMMIVIFSGILLHEPMTARKIISMLLSFLGIVILSLGGDHGTGNAVLGILACILAAACWRGSALISGTPQLSFRGTQHMIAGWLKSRSMKSARVSERLRTVSKLKS